MAETKKKARAFKADWARIEAEFRTGAIPTQNIAKKHKVTPDAIRMRASRYGWTRNLVQKVKDETEAILATSEVDSRMTEEEVIAHGALVRSELIQSHRSDIRIGRVLTRKLFAELAAVTDKVDIVEELIDEETAGDRTKQRRDAMLAAVSLPSRVQSMDKLASALGKLISLERQSFGIKEDGEGESMTYEQLLEKLQKEGVDAG